MDIRVGDILVMKKKHPCGDDRMKVLRVGMDFKLECAGCDRTFMITRQKAEKAIRTVVREEETPCS